MKYLLAGQELENLCSGKYRKPTSITGLNFTKIRLLPYTGNQKKNRRKQNAGNPYCTSGKTLH